MKRYLVVSELKIIAKNASKERLSVPAMVGAMGAPTQITNRGDPKMVSQPKMVQSVGGWAQSRNACFYTEIGR